MAQGTTPAEEYVNFVVGGLFYCMRMSDIKRYTDSYFNTAIKKEWHQNQAEPIIIDRDGEIFKYIVDFHFYGELPMSKSRVSVATVQAIQAEADFYNMPSLAKACEALIIKQIRVDGVSWKENVDFQYASESKDDLVNVVGSVWAPFCLTGTQHSNRWNQEKLFQSSTLYQLNIAELLAEAVQSPFGRGKESVIDLNVRKSFEISADKLESRTLQSITRYLNLYKFAPRMKLEVRPYKLVIYQEGGHFTEHRDSVRGENHIGTLVYILNSEFTGGELVVRRNDTEVSITKPGEWIAMYGDCPHRVEPVTSGTRVSLIYDLYHVGVSDEGLFFQEDFTDHTKNDRERSLDAAMCLPIYRALDKEFDEYTNVVICLTHLYPVCQAVSNGLKSSDDLLYRVLNDADAYDLSIVPITIEKSLYLDDLEHSSIEGGVLDLQCDSADEDTECTKLIIPANVESKEVLSYSEYIHHVGNEPQAERSEYLLTGLRVTKKAVHDGTASVTADIAHDVEIATKRELSDASSCDGTLQKVARVA